MHNLNFSLLILFVEVHKHFITRLAVTEIDCIKGACFLLLEFCSQNFFFSILVKEM